MFTEKVQRKRFVVILEKSSKTRKSLGRKKWIKLTKLMEIILITYIKKIQECIKISL